jgi:hypothetical protein
VDLLDIAILGLRLALVAVLYAFLLVVLRFAGRGLRPPPPAAAPSPASLRLVVLEPGSSSLTTGQVIEVFDGATLGRAAEADIVVADRSISANHARLSRTAMGRGWTLTDLGSTNGTLLNDVRVDEPVTLIVGDVVAVGGVRFKVAGR